MVFLSLSYPENGILDTQRVCVLVCVCACVCVHPNSRLLGVFYYIAHKPILSGLRHHLCGIKKIRFPPTRL